MLAFAGVGRWQCDDRKTFGAWRDLCSRASATQGVGCAPHRQQWGFRCARPRCLAQEHCFERLVRNRTGAFCSVATKKSRPRSLRKDNNSPREVGSWKVTFSPAVNTFEVGAGGVDCCTRRLLLASPGENRAARSFQPSDASVEKLADTFRQSCIRNMHRQYLSASNNIPSEPGTENSQATSRRPRLWSQHEGTRASKNLQPWESLSSPNLNSCRFHGSLSRSCSGPTKNNTPTDNTRSSTETRWSSFGVSRNSPRGGSLLTLIKLWDLSWKWVWRAVRTGIGTGWRGEWKGGERRGWKKGCG